MWTPYIYLKSPQIDLKFRFSAVKNDKNLQTNVWKEDYLNVEFRGQHSCQDWGDVGRRAGRPSRLIVRSKNCFNFYRPYFKKPYVAYRMHHTVSRISWFRIILKIRKASLFNMKDFEGSKISKSSRFEMKFHTDLQQIELWEAQNLRKVSACLILLEYHKMV